MFWRILTRVFILMVLYLEFTTARPPVPVAPQLADFINPQQQQGLPPPEANPIPSDPPIHPGGQWNHRKDEEEEKENRPLSGKVSPRGAPSPATSHLSSPELIYYVDENAPESLAPGVSFIAPQATQPTLPVKTEAGDATSEKFWDQTVLYTSPVTSKFMPRLVLRGGVDQGPSAPAEAPYLGLAFRAECSGQPRHMGKMTVFRNCKWFQRLHIRYLNWFRYAPVIAIIRDIGDPLHPFTVQYNAPFFFGPPNNRMYSILQALVYDFVLYLGQSHILERVISVVDPETLLLIFNELHAAGLENPVSPTAQRIRDYFGTGKFLYSLQEAIRARTRSHRHTALMLRQTRRSMLFLYHGTDHPLMKALSVPTRDVEVLRGREFGEFHSWYGYILMDRREMMLHEDLHQEMTQGPSEANVVPMIPPFKEPVETFTEPPTEVITIT